jgi:putative addiction module component (TIGR02574 family)
MKILTDTSFLIPALIEMRPNHERQKKELARRKANLRNQPVAGLSWEDVKSRVRSRYPTTLA